MKRIPGRYNDENIFEFNDEEAFQELQSILFDPALYGKDFDINDLVKDLRTRLGNHFT